MSSPVSTGIGDHIWQAYLRGNLYRPLSLGHFVGIGAMSTGDGFDHRWGRNGEFCVAVGPITKTAGMLVYYTLAYLDQVPPAKRPKLIATDIAVFSLFLFQTAGP